ncbi:hypothetical protein [Gloeobacter kilaueensis]|uniref:hypothetical protein n=1 Tax=Gloeobacter kilaueensis TaxID=1416614 RepID=UPI0003FA444C|nr:hypothetical protein [Gloeobacter kilaueensis]
MITACAGQSLARFEQAVYHYEVCAQQARSLMLAEHLPESKAFSESRFLESHCRPQIQVMRQTRIEAEQAGHSLQSLAEAVRRARSKVARLPSGAPVSASETLQSVRSEPKSR